MQISRLTSRLQKRKRKSRDFLSSQQKCSRKTHSGRPGRTNSTPSSGASPARTIAMRTSGKACAVFVALESQANTKGYCWPLIATIQKLTGIKTRRAVSRALREFERLGILDRAKLVAKQQGNIAPRLCRIGGRIESLPREAAARFILSRPVTRSPGEKREAP
jgi:hypothetical protein